MKTTLTSILQKRATRAATLALAICATFAASAAAQNTYVYTPKQSSPNSVLGFSVSSTGTLTALPGSPYSVGTTGNSDFSGFFAADRIVVSAATNMLYVTNSGSLTVGAFSINPLTGVLTLVSGSPFATGLPSGNGMSVAVTPDGAYVVVSSGTTIKSFAVTGTGGLGSAVSTAAASDIDAMKISPDGRFLAAADEGSGNVRMFSLSSGVLTAVPGSPFPRTGSELMTGVSFNCGANLLYGGEAGSTTTVDAWSIAANGALTKVTGSPFTSGPGNSNVVLVSPGGKFVFNSLQNSTPAVASFSVGTNGALTLVGRFNGVGVAVGMATDQAGAFLFVSNINSSLLVYSIASNGSLTLLTNTATGGNSEAVAVYPPATCANADIAVTKAAGSTTAQPDANITYTVTVTNNGPNAATVTIGDTLPTTTSFVSCTATGGGVCGGSGNARSISFSSLANGETETITLVAQAGSSLTNGTIISNTAAVSVSSAVDGNTANNSSTASVTVQAQQPTQLVVAMATGTYGGSATLSATLTNSTTHVPVPNKTISFTLNGTPVGSITTDSSGVATLPNVSLTGINAGTYVTGVGASFAGDSSFSSSNGTAQLTVSPAPLTITGNNAARNYGDANPTFGASYSGFVNGENSSVLTGTLSCTSSATPSSPVGGSPYAINCSGQTSANYAISYVAGQLTINRLNASVTPAAASKTYGTADPTFTGTLSGFLASDNVTASYTRTAGETVAGSPYAISATLSPAAVLGNYNITSNTAVFTINKANASVTPNAANKTYGTADPAFAGTLSGFLASDGVSANYSRTAGETVAGSPYAISATLSPAGVLNNYNITSNTASFTINRANASVTPAAASKTYGTADPALTGTLSGFLAADGVTASYSRTAGETVAGSSYTISATLSPAGVLGNYNVTYNTASFTINKANASVTPNAASKTYGSADPTFTGTLSGFLAADNVTATYSRTAGETVAGSPYTMSATLSPAGVLGNYNVTYNTASFTISQAPASVTPNAASKTYGAADPTFTGTLSGFLAADGVAASYSRTAGESVAGSPYNISATLSPAGVLGNYNVTYNTASFTINKANASVTPAAASKTYGTADPALTGTLSGFLAADGVTASYSRTAGETVAGSSYTISATLSPAGVLGNYNVTYNTASFTINKANASVTPNAASKTYGSADPTFTGTLSGFLAADNVTATYSRTAGETVAGSPYTMSATLSPAGVLGNYNVTYNTASFTISQAPASVTPNAASKTYGAADPTFTGTLSGFLAADGVAASYSRTAGESVAGSPYTISATLSPAGVLGNYNITYNTASFAITPAAASATPYAAGKTYGTADPTLTGTLTGFLPADGVTAIYTRTAGETAGLYNISATLSPAAVLGNYNITSNTASFIINKANASVTPNAASKIYGAADPAFTGTLTGFLAADNVTAAYTRTAGETVGGSPYGISATLSPTAVLGNYTITYSTANFSITAKAASVTPNASSKTYGTADPGLTGTLTGFLASDNVIASYSRTAGESVAGSPYTISAALAPAGVLGNYTITYNTASFAIAKATLTVTADNKTKILDAANPSFTATYTGFKNGETLATSGVTGSPSLTTTATTTSPVGTYPIVAALGTLSASNYTFNFVSGNMAILYAPAGSACAGDVGKTILQPVNADGTSVWKQGRTVPVKFRVCDANGVSIGTPGVVSSFMLTGIWNGTLDPVDETVSATNVDTAFRWDSTAQQWIFNLSTSGLSAGNTYIYTIKLNDGTIVNGTTLAGAGNASFQYGLR